MAKKKTPEERLQAWRIYRDEVLKEIDLGLDDVAFLASRKGKAWLKEADVLITELETKGAELTALVRASGGSVSGVPSAKARNGEGSVKDTPKFPKGTVVHFRGHTKRYVVAWVSKVSEDATWWDYLLVALSGSVPGSSSSGAVEDRLEKDANQKVEFVGKKAAYLRRRFNEAQGHVLYDNDPRPAHLHKEGAAQPTATGLSVELEAVPNLDFREGSHQAELNVARHRVPVKSLQDAVNKVDAFIKKYDLGGGNFPPTRVYRDGKEVARVSYNLRVWEPGDWREGVEELDPKTWAVIPRKPQPWDAKVAKARAKREGEAKGEGQALPPKKKANLADLLTDLAKREARFSWEPDPSYLAAALMWDGATFATVKDLGKGRFSSRGTTYKGVDAVMASIRADVARRKKEVDSGSLKENPPKGSTTPVYRFTRFEKVRPSNKWLAVEGSDDIFTWRDKLAPVIWDRVTSRWVKIGKRGPVKNPRARAEYDEAPRGIAIAEPWVWINTLDAYLKQAGEDAEYDPTYFKNAHADHVKSAWLVGAEIPEKVLADYPELQKKRYLSETPLEPDPAPDDLAEGQRVQIKADHWTGMGSRTGTIRSLTRHRAFVDYDGGTPGDIDRAALEPEVQATPRDIRDLASLYHWALRGERERGQYGAREDVMRKEIPALLEKGYIETVGEWYSEMQDITIPLYAPTRSGRDVLDKADVRRDIEWLDKAYGRGKIDDPETRAREGHLSRKMYDITKPLREAEEAAEAVRKAKTVRGNKSGRELLLDLYQRDYPKDPEDRMYPRAHTPVGAEEKWAQWLDKHDLARYRHDPYFGPQVTLTDLGLKVAEILRSPRRRRG